MLSLKADRYGSNDVVKKVYLYRHLAQQGLFDVDDQIARPSRFEASRVRLTTNDVHKRIGVFIFDMDPPTRLLTSGDQSEEE